MYVLIGSLNVVPGLGYRLGPAFMRTRVSGGAGYGTAYAIGTAQRTMGIAMGRLYVRSNRQPEHRDSKAQARQGVGIDCID